VLAVMLPEFGPPSVLTPAELPDPVPGPGQVVVEAAFASITFVETQVRAGRAPNPAMLPALPAVLGNGIGGVVSAVGEGADPALAGTRVVTSTGGSGGYAQRCAVPAAGLIPIPDPLPVDAAVALLADGRTALALADAAAPQPGETVLVEAAAGGVGSLLVQLAKRAGARVVALACCGRRAATPASAWPAAASPRSRMRPGPGSPESASGRSALPRAPSSPAARSTWPPAAHCTRSSASASPSTGPPTRTPRSRPAPRSARPS
jgi:NADPH:quinone reductase-like Zn-dependent oxidoreductase